MPIRPQTGLRRVLIVATLAGWPFLSIAGCRARTGTCGVDFSHFTPPSTAADLLRPTFADPKKDAEVWGLFSEYQGVWKSRRGDTQIVLAPRLPRATDPDPVLFGAVPEGPYEGSFCFRHDPEAAGRLLGDWFPVSRTMLGCKVNATLRLAPDGLELTVDDAPTVALSRNGHANSALLARTLIIGHRCGDYGYEEFANSVGAAQTAWERGCSGVEFDIVVPRTAPCGAPALDHLIAHHPTGLGEITGDDTVSDGQADDWVSAEDVLNSAVRSNAFVYIDPKLKWLARREDDLKDAVNAIVELSAGALEKAPKEADPRVLIAAECTRPGQTGDALAEALLEADAGAAPVWRSIGWTPEFTSNTDPTRYAQLVANVGGERRTPDAISVSILAVGGGALWKDIFVGDMSRQDEELYASLPLPKIVWSAENDSEFEDALRALRTLGALSTSDDAPAAILTAQPHRLAFYLATRPRQ